MATGAFQVYQAFAQSLHVAIAVQVDYLMTASVFDYYL
jgi:hypothetical protein